MIAAVAEKGCQIEHYEGLVRVQHPFYVSHAQHPFYRVYKRC